jgi:predicted DNA-binding protein with PD1-like motif
MKQQFDGYNWLVRLEKGERLVERLRGLVVAEHIKGGWVSSVGAATRAELGYYHLDKQQYEWKKFQQTLEIVSLQGNIAWHEDKPFLHLHGVFSDPDMKTYGGHVRELEVAGTCEVFIHIWNKGQLKRAQSVEAGLKLLNL